ncbi:MAG: phytanoyl-CoA dioxygenase family protein [Pseudomonadota bacterium]
MEHQSRFERDGYALVKGVFGPDEIGAMERDFDRIVRQLLSRGEQVDATWNGAATEALARAGDQVLHTHNVQKYSHVWLTALLAPRFLDAVEALIGPDIILHHTKLFQKPAQHGAPFPMHQDWPYFPTQKDTMIAGIIHVSEATDQMGCLRVWPGSHKEGRLAHAHGRDGGEAMRAYPIEKATAIEAQAGDVVFFPYLTVHGSMPNRSEKTRKTVLCQLYAGHDQISPGNTHPDERMVLRGWNHCMGREAAGQAA